MYEDSVTRMKARFIGTAAGCMLIQILIPLFPGTAWHFLLATVMAAGLYMEGGRYLAAGTVLHLLCTDTYYNGTASRHLPLN